ncbi:N-methyl-L-tryptophan oxidase [Pseudonocardia acaciae]|uniref:N-methyl-L-tryptophan oxidase n=1 Tax=Pseudonocardia acaciae TaxID=551276 RepID=UPI000AFA048E|nr:N-methyl-L-tryptophan oxidase [Pseudonocardia acaciae]
MTADGLDAGLDAEVAVVGVGTMGSMALWALAEAGVPAIGFERFGLGHDRSAVGGETRLFRMAYHESPEYVPLLRQARRLWGELERRSGIQLFTRTGCLSIGDPDSEPMRNVRESIEANDLPHEYLDAPTLRRRYPQHRLRPDEVGLLDLEGGAVRPEFAVLAAAERAVELGARLHTDTVVDEVLPTGDDRVLVRAGGREYRVRHAVLATGPWLGRWLPGLDTAVTARRLVLSWFAPHRPEEFAVGAFPSFIRDTDGTHLFGMPIMDGVSVKAGFGDQFGDVDDPDRFVRDVRPEELGVLRDAVAELLPGVRPDPIRVSVHMDGYTSDRHALVGPLPGQPGVWLLGGFSGHGFKLSPAFGKIMAELIIEGRPSLPIDRFDPKRLLVSG